MTFISVDCGCTNMRCRVFADDKLLYELKKKGGGSTTASTGSNAFLKQSLKEAIALCLETCGLQEKDVRLIMLSGTITSNIGVYHAHHVPAPCGPRESAAGAEYVVLPEITGIPMLFIPGVKTVGNGKGEDLASIIDSFDSMSGEECETYGISTLLGIGGNFTIALPGSYTKTFRVDENKRIISMSSGLCGEFISAVSENTLLGLTLPHPVIREIIPEKIIEGYDYAVARGVSVALAKTRILQLNCAYSLDESGNFFAGAILKDDIGVVLREAQKDKPLIVGGSNPLRHVFALLAEHAGCEASEIIEIDDATAQLSQVTGQLEVLKYFNIENKKPKLIKGE